MYNRLSPKFQVNDFGNVWRIYKEPVKGARYILAADSAAGIVGRNKSAAQILRLDTGEQVAAFSGIISPEKFAEEIEKAGWYYKENDWLPALIVVEIEKYGMIVIHKLKDTYPNLYYHDDTLTGMQANIQKQYGWSPINGRNRQTAIDFLKVDFSMNGSDNPADVEIALKLNDKETMYEMQSFERDEKGKEAARVGKTDDLVAALWICNFVRRERLQHYHKPIDKKEQTFLEKLMEPMREIGRNLGKRDYYTD